MNRLESLINLLSPQWAAKRASARRTARILNQYDLAKIRRANEGWLPPSTSANTEIGGALIMTRNRARDMERNNPYAARIADVWTAHLIGDGITAAWLNADGSANKARQDAFRRWADDGECDADGQLDLYGMQQLATRTMVVSGECLIRKRYRRLSDGFAVPLQLQVIEPDLLDETKNATLTNGGVIIQGVQFSPLGRREGYWLYKSHPGDNFFAFQATSVFVPADQIIHLYRKRRPGQVRGITWLASSGNKIRDLEEYHDALIMKAKIEACQVGAIETPEDNDGPAVGETETETNEDGDELEFQTMEPGTWTRLRPGEKVTFSNPSSGGNHEAYTRQFEQAIAVGAGITYDQLTGDLSKANFASLRAGKIEFRRDASQIQWQTIIPGMCEPIAEAFEMLGQAAGEWGDDGVRAVWMPPRNEPIDPKKDTEAELSDLQAGLESWSDVVSRRGHNPRAHAEKIKADDEMLAGLGLTRLIGAQTQGFTPDVTTEPQQ